MASSFGNAGVGDPVQSCADRPPKHWVEIRLVDQDGKSVPNEEYLVTLPDGSDVRGFLDADGWARFAPLDDAGSCQVSFPGVDGKAWQFDHSEGQKQA